MASKRRTIDPEVLQHPAFRRAGFVERELWIGLILLADDEGRLRADPLTLAETIFSPLCHQVTEAAVDAALHYWADAGWLMLYGDNNAFLTGWYEHQYIQDRGRDSSGIAAPPCTLNSWAVADRIFEWYAASGSKAKTYYRRALRAFAALSDDEQNEIVRTVGTVPGDLEPVRNQFGTSSEPVPLQTERNGTERNTRTNPAPPVGDARQAPAGDESARPKQEPKPLTAQEQAIQDAFTAFPLPGLATGKGYSGLTKLVAEHGIPSVAEWTAWLHTHPQQVPDGASEWSYFCQQFRAALRRPWVWRGNGAAADATRASPPHVETDAEREERVRIIHIAAAMERGEDPFASQ